MSAAVLERPDTSFFEPVNFFDKRVVGANVVRHVFFAGDLIVPERKSEISWLESGGEEMPSPCLQVFGRNYIPRGRAAILTLGGEPIPMQHLGDLQASAWSGMPLNEHAVKNRFGFVPVYPGDGLKVLRRYSMNDSVTKSRKGIDEITALQGKEMDECRLSYNYCEPCGVQYPVTITKCPQDKCGQPLKSFIGDGILDVIELACYGDGMEPTLKGLENQIRHADITDTRIDIGKYKDEILRMCGEFRVWAGRKVSEEHGLLKTGHVGEWQGGWSYSYSPVTEMLLDQLEIPHQDQPLQEMARMVAQVTGQVPQLQGISALDMELIDRRFEEKLEAKLSAAANRIAELEAQVAAKNETEEVAGDKITCDGCGREFKKAIHLTTHQPHCKGPATE